MLAKPHRCGAGAGEAWLYSAQRSRLVGRAKLATGGGAGRG